MSRGRTIKSKAEVERRRREDILSQIDSAVDRVALDFAGLPHRAMLWDECSLEAAEQAAAIVAKEIEAGGWGPCEARVKRTWRWFGPLVIEIVAARKERK